VPSGVASGYVVRVFTLHGAGLREMAPLPLVTEQRTVISRRPASACRSCRLAQPATRDDMPVHARVHVRVGMHMHVRMHVHVRMDMHMRKCAYAYLQAGRDGYRPCPDCAPRLCWRPNGGTATSTRSALQPKGKVRPHRFASKQLGRGGLAARAGVGRFAFSHE
jgi:hypothetical protein